MHTAIIKGELTPPPVDMSDDRRSRPAPRPGWCSPLAPRGQLLAGAHRPAHHQRRGQVCCGARRLEQAGKADLLGHGPRGATWLCAKDRSTSKPEPASTGVLPAGTARNPSIPAGGGGPKGGERGRSPGALSDQRGEVGT